MIHTIAEWVFAWLCQQDPARSWDPGGVSLALCQRCTGVYTGAALMVFVVPWMTFKPSRSLALLHAAFVLQMVVLGLHLVPHPALVRMLSGQLFIVGVAYFVWNNARHRFACFQGESSPRAYLVSVSMTVLALLAVVHAPTAFVGSLIEILALGGACAIAIAAAWTAWDVAAALMSARRL